MPRKPRPLWPPLPRRRRNTGSLQRLADGTLRARLPTHIDPKRKAREFPPDALDHALAWLDDALHPDTTPVASASTTLGDWAGYWWQTYVESTRAPTTARHYRYVLSQLAPLYATPLADVRQSMLQQALNTFAQRVSAEVVQQAAGVWRMMLEAAIDDELLTRNPARRLVLPKTTPRTGQRHLTTKEAAILRSAIVGHRFEAAYALMLGCGLRIGEVLGLAWRDVDLAGRRAWISTQYTDGKFRPLPKGRNPHWIKLPQAVVVALIRHRDRQPEGAALVMQSYYRWAPPAPPKPWCAFTVTSDLHALADEKGLDQLTPHSARRGLSTALLNGGVPAADVAAILGHSSPAVTLKSYSMPSNDAQTIQQAVDAYLDGGAQNDDMGGNRGD